MSARNLSILPFITLAALLVCTAPSCNSLPFTGSDTAANPAEAATADVPDLDDNETELRRVVEKTVEQANADHEAKRAELIRKRPYYYKEYEYYPDGAVFMDIETRETESRTAPMVADVSLRKQRFVTKLHRKRDEARADEDFLRDTGEETITYELRNGEWTYRSSLFVAESVERQIDGVWTPVEEVERTDDAEGEEDLSWFGRIWSSVVGPR